MSLQKYPIFNLSFWQILIANLLLSMVVFYPAISGSFILDDWTYISDNLSLSEASSPLHFWISFDQADYWPLFYSLLWLMWRTFKFSWLFYHLVSVFFHAFNATLVVLIGRRYELRGAVLAGLIFLIHPIQLQSVAWIFQVKTLMATSFLLGSWLCYLEEKESFRWCSLVLFICSLWSKTSVVVFPIVLLINEFYLNQGKIIAKRQSEGFRLSLFVMLSGIFSIFTLYINNLNFLKRGIEVWNGSVWERFLLMWKNLGHYLSAFFFPANLMFVYPKQVSVALSLKDLGIILFIFLLTITLIRMAVGERRTERSRKLVFFLLSYLIFLLPVLGLVNIPYMRNSFVADHWQYLAFTCLVLFFSDIFTGWLNELNTSFKRVVNSVAAIALILISALTFSGARYYESEESIWKHTLETNPNSAFAWSSLGVYYLRSDRDFEAESAFKRAVLIDPSEPPSLYNLSVIAYKKNNLIEAQSLLSILSRLDQNDEKAKILLQKVGEELKRSK